MYILIAAIVVVGLAFGIAHVLDRRGVGRPVPEPLPRFTPIDPTRFLAEQRKLLAFVEELTNEQSEKSYDMKALTHKRQELGSVVLTRMFDDVAYAGTDDTEWGQTTVLLERELLRLGLSEKGLADAFDTSRSIKQLTPGNVEAKVRALRDEILSTQTPIA